MIPTRPPGPLDEPLMPGVERYDRRLHLGGLAVCLAGVVGGILLQRAHVRGQAGLILALVSGMLGVVFASGIGSRRR